MTAEIILSVLDMTLQIRVEGYWQGYVYARAIAFSLVGILWTNRRFQFPRLAASTSQQ